VAFPTSPTPSEIEKKMALVEAIENWGLLRPVYIVHPASWESIALLHSEAEMGVFPQNGFR
jgi:hypothetical protein